MKKILLVSPLPPPIGGIASWTQSFIKYCEENGLDCTIINSAVTETRSKTGKISFLDELKRVLKLRKDLKNKIKENKDKEIIIHYNSSCYLFGLIKDLGVLLLCSKPVIYQCHCNLPVQLNKKISFYLFKIICKIVSVICVLNTGSMEIVKNLKEEVYYIPNFIKKDYVKNKKINKEIKKCCFVGRIEKKKGIVEYVEAAKQCKEKEFYLVGPLKDKSLDFSKISNIKFLGPKSNKEVIEILKIMDVYILPSYTEGFPLGVLEAMSCGLPVIATDVGAISDMIGSEGGVLIKTKSSKEIVDALERISSQDIREKMSIFNINKVKNEYLIDMVMKKFINIYEML